ncbi:hypothetical protein CBW24_17990 (plasmid) [Pacificitalea manganoxidans]|uniref:O-antigen/teichoic acid export membrane protein n=1 Tax=Pacificitalea manganoxidans TaxID=1411902 RepID=A0A291M556_9RHOB|nr:oligosaccharide flippase family protein [Pacificitalea manganoxidans]ATI44034.1 hypothetical protein CBW24_17990 [Pacificitalea manganoxidans]MDR6310395.1 O-antigen/teichoic acid export membrane protein [Pacificitalea manganoxidans]
MSSLGRALAGFMSSSLFGSATQVVKGKVSAIFLGAAGVGVFNQLTLFYTLSMTLASLGLRNGVTRNVAAAQADAGQANAATEGVLRQFSSAFLLVAAVSLLVTAVSVLASDRVSDLLFDDGGERRQLIVLVALAVPIGVAGLIYRALLNGLRVVGPLVRARMIADGSSVIVFAALVIPFGIVGAALGFIFLQAAFLVLVFRTTWTVAPSLAIPRPEAFEFAEARKNFVFGAHSVIVGVTGLGASLFISRLIISTLDLEANGYYVVAVKIATVYLGGLYAAASGYFLSSVVKAAAEKTVGKTIDEAVRLYLAVVAPVIVVLMASGEIFVVAFFSVEFLPVAVILLLLLPGDAVRLVAETMGQALIAQRKLVSSCIVFAVWAAIYCAGAILLLPRFGLLGLAVAYTASQLLLLGVLLVVCRRLLDYAPCRQTIYTVLRAMLLVTSASAACWYVESLVTKMLVCAALVLAWGAVSMRDPFFAGAITKLWRVIRARFMPSR